MLIETTPAGQVVYTYGDDLVSQDRDGVLSLYHYDGLGSTRFLSDAGGAVTDWYDYVAFGEVLNQTGGTENLYLFAGEQFDSSVGQYYLRARYYNQGVGRFTQMDGWMGSPHEPITLHKYLYANGDPVDNIDPTGNMSLMSFSISFNVRGILSTITRTTTRLISRGLKQREWIIHKVTLGPQYLSHEFVWAMNRRTRKGIGYHVMAPRKSVLHSARTGEFVEGQFLIVPQKRVNKILGKMYPIKSKTREAYLGRVGFVLWSAITVGTMREGDSCPFDYQIPTSNCITWTSKAIRNAKWWMLFPL